MSIGTTFDTIKDGFTDTLNLIKSKYAPGKLGTTTKIILTVVGILAIFWVVGSFGADDAE